MSPTGPKIEISPAILETRQAHLPYPPKTPGMYWNKLKMQTQKSEKGKKKQQSYTSAAVGRYSFLNKVWGPVHRISFLDPYIIKNDKELFKVIIN